MRTTINWLVFMELKLVSVDQYCSQQILLPKTVVRGWPQKS